MSLSYIWAAILVFGIMMYIIFDGFDLGVGILFPMLRNAEEQEIALSTILPVWDGNETWLVFGGALLYGAFPIVYSTLLPVLYAPLMIMLFSLVFRGVSFEFHFKAKRSRPFWNLCLYIGSFTAAFMQGVILGTFFQGFPQGLSSLAFDPYQWLTPFSFFTGLGVIVGYAYLGSAWLIGKTLGDLQKRMFSVALVLLITLAVFLVIGSVWASSLIPSLVDKWLEISKYWFISLPLIAVLAFSIALVALKRRYEHTPFYCGIILFITTYLGFILSLHPYIIPRVLTIEQAASDASTLKFILVGVVILLPVLLFYTGYSYYVFKGKVIRSNEY